tara:strand:- start:580 stop:1095 length:516 start_codon:yes stop_codon:yes gene_type:complete
MKIFPKFYLLIQFTLIAMFISCNNQPYKNTNTKIYETLDIYSDSINQAKIDNTNLNTINILNNWIEYQELKGVISSLENQEVSFFKDNKEYIGKFFDGLEKSIPKSIKKPGIISRISVLETKFMILESHFTANIINEKLMKDKINNILYANSNFLYQINKLIEKSNQRIQN